MAAQRRRWAAELLHFWFHQLTPALWYAPPEWVDAELRRRFERELTSLGTQPAQHFLAGPQIALAAVLLFDQVPRNIYRDSPLAFASDPLAQAVCRGALMRGWEMRLTRPQRQILGMPLMHSEHIADQLAGLAYFAQHSPSFGFPFARDHYRMIARFGRFPHRNAVLGRASTPAERRAVEAGFSW